MDQVSLSKTGVESDDPFTAGLDRGRTPHGPFRRFMRRFIFSFPII
jgi:hypothetical protein